MSRAILLLAAVWAALVLGAPLLAPAAPVDNLKAKFANPPADSRPMMRWWWFGPSVSKPELEREMRVMRDAGLGGFEVQSVYPLQVDNPAEGFRNLTFLSPEFQDALKFTGETARSLGLRMDVTLGSGWPYGGPQVSIDRSSGRLRFERVKTAGGSAAIPTLREGEKFIAAFDGTTHREIANVRDSAVLSDAPEVWFFIASRTRQMVKRPAAGGEGYVLDHYDPAAVDHYLSAVGDRLLQSLAAAKPYAIFCDSLEVYGADWTGNLLEEFRTRRGYDLRPFLPALAADIGPETPAIRYDWGRTLTEVFADSFLRKVHQWAQQRGVKFRVQNYGIPPAVLSGYQYADLAEGEGAQWEIVRASRWASSASHLLGRPVTSSETWTWLHSPVFRATPLDLKAEADLHFIEGINQLIGHGFPYTAPGAEYPGWRFYAAAALDEKNPWWIVMPDLARYLQRVSFLLRQGEPVNDIALYLPESDAWSQFSLGKVHMIDTLRELVGTNAISQILAAGYGFDFVDDGTIDRMIASHRYRAVVLPGVEFMPPETALKLAQYSKAGGVVIATKTKPILAPGKMAGESAHAIVRSLPAKLVEQEDQLGPALQAAIAPDMGIAPASPEIAFIHRKTESRDIYFVVNTGNVHRKFDAAFRVAALNPESWNPMTGEIYPLVPTGATKTATTIQLDLDPYESRIIVFSAAPAQGSAPRIRVRRGIEFDRGWTVRFQDREPVPYDRLHSWTDDESTRFFSGAATYERTFQLPSDWQRSTARLSFGPGTPVPMPAPGARASNQGVRAWLDSPVREAAVVYVNGQRAGSVWCPPYSLDVAPFLHPGENRLRIVVANLALNQMAGHPLPDYRELRARYGNRFDPQDMDQVKPMPSGLLGPVVLALEH